MTAPNPAPARELDAELAKVWRDTPVAWLCQSINQRPWNAYPVASLVKAAERTRCLAALAAERKGGGE